MASAVETGRSGRHLAGRGGGGCCRGSDRVHNARRGRGLGWSRTARAIRRQSSGRWGQNLPNRGTLRRQRSPTIMCARYWRSRAQSERNNSSRAIHSESRRGSSVAPCSAWVGRRNLKRLGGRAKAVKVANAANAASADLQNNTDLAARGLSKSVKSGQQVCRRFAARKRAIDVGGSSAQEAHTTHTGNGPRSRVLA